MFPPGYEATLPRLYNSILTYWHQLEHFLPYNLEECRYRADGVHYIRQTEEHEALPWSSPKLREKLGCTKESYRYTLYLGVFDERAVLKTIKDSIGDSALEPFHDTRNLKGESCYASLPVNPDGEPLIGQLSLSTLPWAVGRAVEGKLDHISRIGFSEYQHAIAHEWEKLAAQIAKRSNPQLQLPDIYELLSELFHTNFWKPEHLRAIALCTLHEIPPSQTQQKALSEGEQQVALESNISIGSKIENATSLELVAEKSLVEETPVEDEEEEKEEKQEKQSSPSILNSFYIGEIESVREAMRKERPGSACNEFLFPQQYDAHRRIDFLDTRNDEIMWKALSPKYTPECQWPSNSSQKMSVMQQLAINGIAALPHTGKGIFAVNGPPGTGKTTMLRDVIADVICRRADQLAEFTTVADTLENPIPLADNQKLRPLDSRLTGFEMVVASTNNNAVRNISRELPRVSALGSEWSEKCQYLKPVAKSVWRNRKTHMPPEGQHEVWGMICAELGKKSNRNAFFQGFFHIPERKKLSEEQLQQISTIFDWYKSYDGPSFSEAKFQFRSVKDRVLEEKKKLLNLESRVTDCMRIYKSLGERGSSEAQDEYRDEWKRLKQEAQFLGVGFIRGRMNLCEKEIQSVAPWLSERYCNLRSELFVASLHLHEAWLAALMRYHDFSKELYFVGSLLGGNPPAYDRETFKALWQILFMAVPVVSTTFASLPSMFGPLGKEDLGYLLIDEAGQASPQAAIGALWRCRHAIIVGDPMQIEPVVSMPERLPSHLGAKITQLGETVSDWSPISVSTQQIADRVSSWGAHIIRGPGDRRWVGCPLRVHRRCLEPMFSISNTIAYNDFMHNATTAPEEANSFFFGESRWIDIRGQAKEAQWVLEQGLYVLNMIRQYTIHFHTLPDMFLITPFRRVRARMQELVKSQLFPAALRSSLGEEIPLPSKDMIRKWARNHVGTLHTFQGKEAESAILLLGADSSQPGAISWASSSPNLLNVAVTRARYRFYIVGNYPLWSKAGCFAVASTYLPRDTPVMQERAGLGLGAQVNL